jgi:hypothetical protein
MHGSVRFLALAAAIILTGCGHAETEKGMEWSDPLDPVVITTDEVIMQAKPILLVIHDAGQAGWQFMDGSDVTGKKPRVVTKDQLMKIDPTIKGVTDLPVGWEARRESASSSWSRQKR